MALRALSLCAGVAGIDLGLRLADPTIRTVCYVEWARFPAAVLAARMEDQTLDPAPVWDDVGTFDGNPWRGAVDLITAGFPCQPVSLAGKRLGMADERFIWGDVARIIGEIRPGRVLLENVPGILTADGGAFLGRVLGDLVELGFDCEWDLFSAEETGAPHRRQRWFCLAYAASSRGRYGTSSCRSNAAFRVGDREPPQGEQGGDGGLRSRADLRGEALAVSAIDGPEYGVQRQRIRPEPAGSGEQLADAALRGQRAGRVAPGRDRQPDGSDGPLGESAILTEREPDDETHSGTDGRQAGRVPGGCRVYPPARNDHAGWAGIAKSAQPSVCRDLDGSSDDLDPALFAYRNDRLRALGNGVVPLTCALAWIELNRRIGGNG